MKTIDTEIGLLKYNKESNILFEKIKEGSNITLKNIHEHYELANALTKLEKHVALVDTEDLFSIDQSALKYLSTAQKSSGRIATAFYSKNLPNRLTLLFLKLIYKPNTPIELFTNKIDALNWLEHKKKHHTHNNQK